MATAPPARRVRRSTTPPPDRARFRSASFFPAWCCSTTSATGLPCGRKEGQPPARHRDAETECGPHDRRPPPKPRHGLVSCRRAPSSRARPPRRLLEHGQALRRQADVGPRRQAAPRMFGGNAVASISGGQSPGLPGATTTSASVALLRRREVSIDPIRPVAPKEKRSRGHARPAPGAGEASDRARPHRARRLRPHRLSGGSSPS